MFDVLYVLHLFNLCIYKQCIHTGKCFPLVGVFFFCDVTSFIKPMCTASQRIVMGIVNDINHLVAGQLPRVWDGQPEAGMSTSKRRS